MKARPVEDLDPTTAFRENAVRIVSTRLEELRAFASSTRDPAASRTQHDMRIAAKRLRYVLEVVGPCIGPEAKSARDAAKQLQGTLGEIHDCDVMLEMVAEVESLHQILQTRRELLFRQLGVLWDEQTQVWADLQRALF